MSPSYFKNKKVLVFGLGLLGGGVATTNWLLKQGARVTITDLKDQARLLPSVKKIKGKAVFRLGGHDEKDIRENDIIVINPDVSIYNPYIQLAKKLGKAIENEATIFYKLCPKPIIAVTGTRGKTTTTNWLAHFSNSRFKAVVSGNSYIEPLLKTLSRLDKFSIVANEIPSFHLELFDGSIPPPSVAVITNIFQDHLNRYRSFEDYVRTKANIFKHQTSQNSLVLNYDNNWTSFLLRQKPRAKIRFFSVVKLPEEYDGVFSSGPNVFFQEKGKRSKIMDIAGFKEKWGSHNVGNLLAGSLAAHLAGVDWADIEKRLGSLPQIPFRQETIFESKRLKIINDTCATSPDGGIAAIERFAVPSEALAKEGWAEVILITGGTDRQLDYRVWARTVSKEIKPENIIMLSGSATGKMLSSLGKPYVLRVSVLDTLKECIEKALVLAKKHPNSVILFSPASKSFEKFKNEYDRGEKFNRIVNQLMRKR